MRLLVTALAVLALVLPFAPAPVHASLADDCAALNGPKYQGPEQLAKTLVVHFDSNGNPILKGSTVYVLGRDDVDTSRVKVCAASITASGRSVIETTYAVDQLEGK